MEYIKKGIPFLHASLFLLLILFCNGKLKTVSGIDEFFESSSEEGITKIFEHSNLKPLIIIKLDLAISTGYIKTKKKYVEILALYSNLHLYI